MKMKKIKTRILEYGLIFLILKLLELFFLKKKCYLKVETQEIISIFSALLMGCLSSKKLIVSSSPNLIKFHTIPLR